MDILNRIQPTCIKDVVGNKMPIKNLLDILKQPTYSPKVIVLLGPTGCGKTLICNLIFKELNFKVFYIDSKESLQHIETFIVHKTIDCFEENPRRKLIFVDNIDILMNTERSALSTIDNNIVHLIRTNTYMVVTSKLSEEKNLTNTFKKNAEYIKISYPTIKDAFAYLSDKLPDIEETELLNITKKQRGNIRDIVLNIKSTEENMNQIVQHRGYSEYSNFEIVASFLQDCTWNDVLAILNNDPSIISYLLYENIVDDIYNNREATSVMRSYTKINNYYIDANIMEKYLQHTLDWSVYKYIQLIKIGSIYCTLQQLKRKKERKDNKLRFSQVLSKLSHKNMMQKKFDVHKISDVDLIHLIDSKSIRATDDIKQISSTYHKYFA